MEVLTDILRSMRVTGSVYFCDRMKSPWSVDFHGTTSAGFHMVRLGQAQVRFGDQEEILKVGDLIFLEAGVDHTLASVASEAELSQDETVLLCGYCDFSRDTGFPLADAFPTVTIVRDQELRQHPWLKSTLEQLGAEYLSQQPGSELVVDKLTEVVLVELIRINFGRSHATPFIQALTDKKISKALHRIHAAPQAPWTLEKLAQDVGMSRAAFAQRFKELVGRTMFDYLTNIRVKRAEELLSTTKLPVYVVANKVGYESDIAFTKVFKKQNGITPTRFRKDAVAG